MAAPATVQISVQKIDVNPIIDVIVTPIIKDQAGLFIRAFRFYGAPSEGGSEPTLLLEVLARAVNSEEIDIAIPASTF